MTRFLSVLALMLVFVAAPAVCTLTGCFPAPEIRGNGSFDTQLRAGDAPRQFRITLHENAAAQSMGQMARFHVAAHAATPCTPGTEVVIEFALRRVDGTLVTRETRADVCAGSGTARTSFDPLLLETCDASGCSTAVDVFVTRLDAATTVDWTGLLLFQSAIVGSGDYGGEELTVGVVEISPAAS